MLMNGTVDIALAAATAGAAAVKRGTGRSSRSSITIGAPPTYSTQRSRRSGQRGRRLSRKKRTRRS